MAVQIRELNDTNCKTYLLSSKGQAVLVDPVRERLDRYRAVLANEGLELVMVLETHLHADHLMFNREIRDELRVPFVMHEASPSPLVDRHVREGDVLELGGERIRVLHTPGHTPDSVSYVFDGGVFTGDTLLIGGSGRTDFPGGDPGAQYDAITGKLFKLPGDTIVWPAHDYRGKTSSTIELERATNPRLAERARADYVALMNGLNLPFPDRIQEVLQINQSGFEASEVSFPRVAEVAAARSITPRILAARLAQGDPPVVVDVREPEEFVGELGHIAGALLVPMDMLERRLPKLAGYSDRELVVACRAGARSASACAILQSAGFRSVFNLDGGMLAWAAAGLGVQR